MSNRECATAVAALAATLTAFALYAFFAVPPTVSDFSLFYRTGQLWLSGESPYSTLGANLNPPVMIAAVFAPLARLPYKQAQLVWTILSMVCVVASARLAIRELRLPRLEAGVAVSLLFLTFGSFYAWMNGQVTWVLLYPVTRAWIAYRHGHLAVAGMWLAPTIVVKPFLAIVAVLLPWPLWTVAGVASVAVSGLGILWTGWAHWQRWFEVGADVWWLAYPANSSLWGLASRLQTGDDYGIGINDLHPAWVGIVAVVGVAGAVVTVREEDRDRRVSRAVTVMLALSPLGWVYYLPLIFGPLTAVWPQSHWMIAALICFCVPMPLLTQVWAGSPLIIRTLGSAYTLGLWCLWMAHGNRQAEVYHPVLQTR